MKKLARLAFETVCWLFCFMGVANAGPLLLALSSFATFLGGNTILAAVIKLAIGVALKIGIGLLQRAMQPKQRPPGIKSDVQVGGDNPLSFIVGNYATSGQLEYVNTYGKNSGDTPNAFLVQVISLSDLPIAGIGSTIWVDGKKCMISGSLDAGGRGYGVTEYLAGSNYCLWVKFHDGSQTTVDTYLTDKFAADPDRPFQTDMIGRGVPYAIVTAVLERKFFNNIPKFRFELQGMKLYDVSKDSTNGGSGSHRWTDQTTWEFTANNAVITYNITRGIYYNGDWIYGGQNLPAALLPSASWIAAINECNVAIALNAGGTEPQYRAGYEVNCDQEPLDVIELFLDGCSGRMSEIGGFYKIKVGAPTASVYSFTDSDIIATQELEFDPFPGLEQTYNGAHASYPEPLEGWQIKDAPVYLRTDYETADEGRRLLAALTFSTTPYNTQVQRLMKAAVEANRKFRRHVVPLPPEAWLLEPGDTISWSSTREGYSNKKFLISQMTGKQTMVQFLSLQEIDASDYDWTPATDEKAYSTGYVGNVTPAPQEVVGWSVAQGTFYDDAAGARRPSIAVTYSATQFDVRAVRIEVFLASSGVQVYDSEIPYNDPDNVTLSRTQTLNAVFLPNTAYLVTGQFIPYSDRETVPTFPLSVTTPNILLGDQDVYLPGMVADINAQIFPINTNVRDLIDQKRKIALQAMNQDNANYGDKQYVLQQITANYNGVTADYQSAILVAAGPNSVIVQRLDTLDAAVPGMGAAQALSSLSVTVGVQDGKITANSDAVQALNAVVGGNIATTLFRATAEATEAGALATIGLSVSATAGGIPSTAAITLSALAGGISRVGILADQFFIKSAGFTQNPFVYEAGVLRLNVLNAGTIVAGVFTDQIDPLLRKFVMTPATGSIEWYE